jgi:hypothetical protein
MRLGKGQFWAHGPALCDAPTLIKIAKAESGHGRNLTVRPRAAASGSELRELIAGLKALASQGGHSKADGPGPDAKENISAAPEDLRRALEAERAKRRAAEMRAKELEAQLARLKDEIRTDGEAIPQALAGDTRATLSQDAARLLRTLSTYPLSGISKPALALVSGTSVRSQRFVRPLAELIAHGFVRDRKSGIRVTEEGRSARPEEAGTGADFEAQLSVLHSGLDFRTGKMLTVLAAAHPSKLKAGELASLIGLTPKSRKLKPCLDRLSRKGLITRSGDSVLATDAYAELRNASQMVGAMKNAA